MTDKNLDRAKKLLERAGHPNTPEEEARSAAVLAARMIYEHGFLIVSSEETPSVPAQPAVEPRAAATAAATAAHVQRIWDVVNKQSARFQRVQAGLEPQIMPSRYPGDCKSCGRPYAQGETVAWMPGRGVTHFDCRGYWSASASTKRKNP